MKQLLTSAGFATMLMLAAGFISCHNIALQDPKIGDIWRWHTLQQDNNPYHDKTRHLRPYYDYKVIDVKDGYVQYMDLSDSTIDSYSITVFKAGAERLSTCR